MASAVPSAEILYPVSEVAVLWRCSVDHVYDLIAAGELDTVKIPDVVRSGARSSTP
jgi:hypothetical protein